MFEHCSELEGSINYYYVQENFTVKPKNFMCSDIVLKYANIQQFGRYKTEHMLFVICVTDITTCYPAWIIPRPERKSNRTSQNNKSPTEKRFFSRLTFLPLDFFHFTFFLLVFFFSGVQSYNQQFQTCFLLPVKLF